ncbi:hypothetical protein J2Y45_003232 [Dyadobacter sp. BE34]|uniref:Membrane-associated oxidoreductase n=1 Tax=Dyadobacter fermentans TaxID=94254 RepID=A0ABU1QY26_9BACT|nr:MULTISPECIES: hypothetical protein [Dyadobacter]MDR6806040.1 hypothetical protein [Dyadobacter fermentans]MDR7043781.1 hypothetical protein [Dyadobacter sp. BE242]MDR7198092.1 hypothetical protein [Dyadobacter sp. BE34]MDR7216055.1 hypothetical protein [Dyadobacter sp. BE31]MDR7264419.1 hypothetical protein [Dyadobacter sp. BE32]
MNRDELFNKLLTEIDHFTWSGKPEPDWIELSDNLEGNINLSEILMEAFRKAPKNEDIKYDFERFDFKIKITGNFEVLRIDSRFPKDVIIDDCIGKDIEVSRYLTEKFVDDELVSIRVYDSEIKNIMVIGNIRRFISRGIQGCNKFEINQLNNTTILQNRYSIRGSFSQIHLLGVSSEYIVIEAEQPNDSVAKIKVKAPQISRLDITSTAECELSIYDEGKVENLNVVSHAELRSLSVSSASIKESQIRLMTDTCGPVTFDEVRSIEFFKIWCPTSIPDCNVESITLTHCSLQKNFTGKVANFDVNRNISFEHFINYGDFSFEYVNVRGRMICKNSVLGRFALFNSSIGNTMEIDGSNIEEMKFLGTQMPTNVVVYGLLPGNTAKTKQMEGYRQLKLISERNSNKEQANFYRSKELNAHLASLKLRTNLADILVLNANKISNKHGMNWLRTAFLILFAVGPILFSAFIFNVGYRFDCSPEGFINFKLIWKNYLDFLIPGYLYPSKDKFLFLKEINSGQDGTFSSLSTKSKLIVFLNDIVAMPYLIVQLITAFRKHGNK